MCSGSVVCPLYCLGLGRYCWQSTSHVTADNAVEVCWWLREKGKNQIPHLLNYCPRSYVFSLIIWMFDLSLCWLVAGGKTPDPNKRGYADVMAEMRLRNEEVCLYSCDDLYLSTCSIIVNAKKNWLFSLSLSLSVCLSLSLSSVKFTKLLLTRKRRVYLVHLVLISLALGREGGGTCNRHLMSMLQLQRNQPGMRWAQWV